MNELDLMTPSKVAEKYGGDKRKIAEAARMGIIDPTVAVMAGMFIDRMRGAAVKEQQPQTTVAQDVMAPAGVAAVSPVDRGLTALPAADQLYSEDSFAGGGIIAFDDGGKVQRYQNQGAVDTSPFQRDIGSWAAAQRRSMEETTPGMIGAYKQPWGSPDDVERMALMEKIQQIYGPKASLIGGYFATQSDEEREKAKNIISNLSSMSTEEMRQLAGGRGATPALTKTAAAAYPDETTRGTAKSILAGDIARRDFAAPKPEVVTAAQAPVQAPASAKTEAETEDMLARRKRMLREAGVPEDSEAAARAALSEARGKLGQERSDAAALAMIEAGLGIAGGKSQYALQNLAEAKGAIGSYAKSLRQLKEDEKEYDKIARDIDKAEEARKRGDVDKALEYEDKAEQRRIQLISAEAQRTSAERPTASQDIIKLLKSSDPAERRIGEIMAGTSKTGEISDTVLFKEWNDLTDYQKIKLAKMQPPITTFGDYKNYVRSSVGGTAAPSGSRTVSFGSLPK